MGISLKIKQSDLAVNGILLLQYIIYIMYMFSGSSRMVNMGVIVGAVGYLYIVSTMWNKKYFPYAVGVMAAIFIVMFINTLTVGNYRPPVVVREVLTYGCTAILLTKRCVNKKLFLWLFYGFAALTWLRILQAGEPFEIFAGHSRNYISLYLIVVLFPYYTVSAHNKTERISIIPSIICLAISVYILGRGGIIMCAMLFLGTCLKNILLIRKTDKELYKKSRKYAVLSVVLIGAAIYIFMNTNIAEQYLYRFTDNESGGFADEQRLNIWMEYISRTLDSLKYIITGYDLSKSRIIVMYLENLHNSYLMLHCYTGLFGLLLFVAGLINSISYMIKNKKYDLLIIVFSFLVKAFTDWVFPTQLGDIIVLYVLVYPIIDRRKRKDEELAV